MISLNVTGLTEISMNMLITSVAESEESYRTPTLQNFRLPTLQKFRLRLLYIKGWNFALKSVENIKQKEISVSKKVLKEIVPFQ